MNDEATPSASSTPSITSITSINIATAGSGIDSLMIKTRATPTMINVRWPSGDNPSGEGK